MHAIYTLKHEEQEQQKHPVYKDKSDIRRKLVIVRGTLYMKLYNQNNFWYILCFCRPTLDLQKDFLLKYWRKKIGTIFAIISITSGQSPP